MKSDSKKVLIIAYYWPPSGGSGVQRWLKFVKYLPQYGWQPYVFTPENPAFAIKDESLMKDVPDEAEVIHFPIWEPYEAFFTVAKWFGTKATAKPTALVSTSKQSLFQRVSTWIRGNILVPDPRRFWIKPASNFLDEFLRENDIRTIITTGPPHSIHLIGLRLKKKDPSINWIADFRDPWSEWGFLDTLKVSPFVRNIHRKLERKVITSADHVVTITPFYVRQFERLSGRKVTLLTNGFDEDDFAQVQYTRSPQFLIRHVGIVNEKCDPRPFMTAVENLCREEADFKNLVLIEFVGDVHPHFHEFVEQRDLLRSITKFTASVPHKELIRRYGESSLLLLVLTGYKDAEGYMPGKLFEYLATGLPILGVGPTSGDAASLLNTTTVGKMVDGDSVNDIALAIKQRFHEWKNSSDPLVQKSSVDQYSRRAITGQLTKLFRQPAP